MATLLFWKKQQLFLGWTWRSPREFLFERKGKLIPCRRIQNGRTSTHNSTGFGVYFWSAIFIHLFINSFSCTDYFRSPIHSFASIHLFSTCILKKKNTLSKTKQQLRHKPSTNGCHTVTTKTWKYNWQKLSVGACWGLGESRFFSRSGSYLFNYLSLCRRLCV